MIKVSEIMTTPVITIRGSATVAEAVQRMLDHGVHALIVDRHHAQDAYGIVTETDVVTQVLAFGRDPKRLRVYEIMTKPCIVVNPDLGVEYVARLFRNTGIHVAPVIQAELLGIVSTTDLLKPGAMLHSPQEAVLTQQLEEATALAEKLCQQFGVGSLQCAEAWTKVDALQTELAHQQQGKLEKTAFEAFREANPGAFPDTLGLDDYQTWCSG